MEITPVNELVAVAKALSDESRARMLLALRRGEVCVCQLVALVELAPSTVSKHMSVLKQAGLVVQRKEGRWVYYRLPGAGASRTAALALEWLSAAARSDRRAAQDRKKLREILACDMEEICRRVSGR